MRRLAVICGLILTLTSLVNAMNLRVVDGRPIVDGVYVNDHGPYRFLLDTGSNINLIETKLGRSIGMNATFQVDLTSAAGKTTVSGSDGNEIVLGSVKADGQKFLFSGLEAIRGLSSDIQGILGQWFLSRFDYLIDLHGKRLEFGKRDWAGTRVPLKFINGRLAVATSLGELILDSGTARLLLFGVEPDAGVGGQREWSTVAGSQRVGMAIGKEVVIEGRKFWRGDAVAIPNQTDPDVAGLLPVGLFNGIYVCNSGGYIILN